MNELNDIGVSIFVVLLVADVWFTYKIYNNEYKENKEDNNKVLKRGNEWD